MQRMLWMAVTACTIGLAGAAAAAAFADVDADGDAVVTAEEFTAAYPDVGDDVWVQIDANADGEVTEDEFQAAIDAGLIAE